MTDILGEADFTRVEGQIGIWQFRQKNCVVDFFFMPPMQMATRHDSLLQPWMSAAGLSASHWMRKAAAKSCISGVCEKMRLLNIVRVIACL